MLKILPIKFGLRLLKLFPHILRNTESYKLFNLSISKYQFEDIND